MVSITPDFCFVLNGRGGGKRIDMDDIALYKTQKLWIHADYKDTETQEWLMKMDLGDRVIENLLDEDTSPRYFPQKKGLLVVMRGVNTQRNADIDDMIAVHMWIEKSKIITLSHRSVPSMRKIQTMLKNGKGPKTPTDCFITLAKNMTANIEKAIVKIDDEVDEIEEAVIEQESYRDKELRSQISELRHKIVGLRRYIVPQRDVVKIMRNISHPVLSDENLNELREIYQDLSQAVEDLNFARDHSTVTQEELDSKTNINISQTMYIMSIVMVIFTPLTFITGLLGANIGGIPFGEDSHGFIFISLILLAIAVLQLSLLKKMKWF